MKTTLNFEQKDTKELLAKLDFEFFLKQNLTVEKYNVCKQNGIDLIHIFEFEDFEEWLNILKQYIQNSDKYKIVYKNNHRSINYSNSKLDFYGESFIKLQASFKTPSTLAVSL